MKSLKRIAIDMDGVLADTETQYITWYYNTYGVKVSYDELVGKPEGDGFPDKTAVGKFLLTPGFFRSLPLMPGAVEAVAELMKDFEIFIVSAAMEFPKSLSEKQEWLCHHFPFISWSNVVFCGDKSVIQADYMIDDHHKNLAKFKGTPILFNAAHNTLITDYQRVRSWKEVVELIKATEAIA
jgi:5'-nucleotidase